MSGPLFQLAVFGDGALILKIANKAYALLRAGPRDADEPERSRRC